MIDFVLPFFLLCVSLSLCVCVSERVRERGRYIKKAGEAKGWTEKVSVYRAKYLLEQDTYCL